MSWEVVENSWQYTSIYGSDGKRIFLMDLEDWGVTEENQEELEKQQADIARLASQAPNLLETLIQTRDFLSMMQVAPSGLIAVVDDAISKAEGRS